MRGPEIYSKRHRRFAMQLKYQTFSTSAEEKRPRGSPVQCKISRRISSSTHLESRNGVGRNYTLGLKRSSDLLATVPVRAGSNGNQTNGFRHFTHSANKCWRSETSMAAGTPVGNTTQSGGRSNFGKLCDAATTS